MAPALNQQLLPVSSPRLLSSKCENNVPGYFLLPFVRQKAFGRSALLLMIFELLLLPLLLRFIVFCY